MIFGMHGVSRAGKDSVANYLVSEHGFTRVALADAVREAVYILNPMFPWTMGSVHPLQGLVDEYGWDEVKSTTEGRRLLQVMGTEIGRNMFGEFVWLDIAARKVEAAPGPVVVTDIRFENELTWLCQWSNSLAIKVTRPGYGPVNAHASDAGLPDELFDYHIKNRGTLGDLNVEVDKLLEKFGW